MDGLEERRAIVYGALLGAALGALGAWGWRRMRTRAVARPRRPVRVEGIVRLGTTVMQLLRQLSELV